MIRVLLVDDQALVRTGFRMILKAEPDIDVVGEAADGAQAVDATRRLRPDVVVMDVRMPHLDGLEATRRILADDRRPPRVLMLTTFDLDEYVYDALRAGASGFLLKDGPGRSARRGDPHGRRRRRAARPDGHAPADRGVRAPHAGHRTDAGRPRRADRARARRAGAARARALQRRDRGRAASSAKRRSRPTSRACCPSSACATGPKRSSTRTSPGSSTRRPAASGARPTIGKRTASAVNHTRDR